jgi:hypothetical protein
MKVSRLIAALALTAFACSAQKDESNDSKKTVTESEAKEIGKTLPKATIVRVPLDSNGQPINEAAELRTLDSLNESVSAERLPELFGNAAVPTSVLGELNETTSKESCGWNKLTYKYKGNGTKIKMKVKTKGDLCCIPDPCDYGCGNNNGGNYAPPASGGGYYQQSSAAYGYGYQPSYNYYGFSYLYQYAYYYNQPQYAYYMYNQQFSQQGYNSYGPQPGMPYY